ncbi:hypothetical protein GF360_02885 [candidate division WWE3 bacterium]|nr:hypothetical protein [candidate division WWE3 bacterium]
MSSQIDKKLEKLLVTSDIQDTDIKEYLGEMPKNNQTLLEILKNIRKHIRTYGRKSDSLENYIELVKERVASEDL